MNYTNEQIWGALSTRRKDQLLEANRDVNVQFDWWTSTYESFVEDCRAIGIEVDPERIHFSGFWSQGDGACFEGHYRHAKGAAPHIHAYAPQDTELHRIADSLPIVCRIFPYPR